MANTKKAIYYPRTEGEIKTYYDNAATKLIGPIGVKYGTDAGTITLLTGHKTNVPLVIQKAYDDSQQSQASTIAKNSELATAKVDILREINRITGLATWDENDAELLGIRVNHAPVDINTVKPIISKATALPDQNILDWVKGAMEGVIIECIEEVDQPDSPMPPSPPGNDSLNWKPIGTDQKSPFEDKRPNQKHRPELRYYRMRYTDKDGKPVGLYSLITPVVSEIYPVG